MKMNDIDYLVETDDLLEDCIYASVEVEGDQLLWCPSSTIDINSFIEEFKSRSKKVRAQAIYDLIGAKSREEFEDMIQEICLLGRR